MSNELAEKLMSAESPEAFLKAQNDSGGWQTVSALKSEVDRLVGCDLKSAASLAGRIERVATLVGDPVSRAFAEASRARVLNHSGHHSQANALYESASRALRDTRLKTEAALVQMQQLHALILMGRYADALRTASAARRVLSRGNPLQLAQLEANVGNIYYRLDRYRKALEHYDRARGAGRRRRR